MYYRIKKKNTNLYLKNWSFFGDHELTEVGQIFSLNTLRSATGNIFNFSVSYTYTLKDILKDFEIESCEITIKKPTFTLDEMLDDWEKTEIVRKLRGK